MADSVDATQPPATVTVSAEATSPAGTATITHGPLTIDLTEIEQKVASKLLSPLNRVPTTFEEVIGDGGQFANFLEKIKGAYEEFITTIVEKQSE